MRRHVRSALGLAFVVALASIAGAQGFNVDIGSSTHPRPAVTFGGGGSQPGYWNLLDETSAPGWSMPLRDLAGQLTSVTITVTRTGIQGQLSTAASGSPLAGDAAALFDDAAYWLNAPPTGQLVVTVSGLAPGAYDWIVYAGSPFSEGSVDAGPCISSALCASFDGTFTEGSAWRATCCATASGTVAFTTGTCFSPLSFAAISGIQVVPRAFACGTATTQAYCVSGALPACACPCGNCGGPDRGCENSYGTGGGRLTIAGVADVSSDALVLQAAFLPPTTSALFFQGTNMVGNGFGAPFEDGTLCVGGTLVRLGARLASGGACALGSGAPGDPHVSVAGGVPAGGGTRYYQVWYRDAQPFCTAAFSNLTGAYRVVWVP